MLQMYVIPSISPIKSKSYQKVMKIITSIFTFFTSSNKYRFFSIIFQSSPYLQLFWLVLRTNETRLRHVIENVRPSLQSKLQFTNYLRNALNQAKHRVCFKRRLLSHKVYRSVRFKFISNGKIVFIFFFIFITRLA